MQYTGNVPGSYMYFTLFCYASGLLLKVQRDATCNSPAGCSATGQVNFHTDSHTWEDLHLNMNFLTHANMNRYIHKWKPNIATGIVGFSVA